MMSNLYQRVEELLCQVLDHGDIFIQSQHLFASGCREEKSFLAEKLHPMPNRLTI